MHATIGIRVYQFRYNICCHLRVGELPSAERTDSPLSGKNSSNKKTDSKWENPSSGVVSSGKNPISGTSILKGHVSWKCGITQLLCIGDQMLWLGRQWSVSYLDPEASSVLRCTLWGGLIGWTIPGTSGGPNSGWSCVPCSYGRSNVLLLWKVRDRIGLVSDAYLTAGLWWCWRSRWREASTLWNVVPLGGERMESACYLKADSLRGAKRAGFGPTSAGQDSPFAKIRQPSPGSRPSQFIFKKNLKNEFLKYNLKSLNS